MGMCRPGLSITRVFKNVMKARRCCGSLSIHPPVASARTRAPASANARRFGLKDGTPRTLDEVARQYGITRERIRQIEARGLLKLRQPTRSCRLEEFADADEEK